MKKIQLIIHSFILHKIRKIKFKRTAFTSVVTGNMALVKEKLLILSLTKYLCEQHLERDQINNYCYY